MNTLQSLLLSTIILVLTTARIMAQGCSDAGVCTMSSFKPSDSSHSYHQIKVGAFVGKADNAITVFGNYVEYNTVLSDVIGIDVKLTTLAQSGRGISTFGLSDIFVNANYKTSEALAFTLGVKIPLLRSNTLLNSSPLPMDFQSSLGTFDLIAGIGYVMHGVQFIAALQQPLTQNSNQFLASTYPSSSTLRAFQSTNRFQRGGDVLIRVSYPFALHEKLTLTPSILPIYHLQNDKYADESNIERDILGSRGLTLNANAYLDYMIDNTHSIQLSIGLPFIVRSARPDGLTRSFIANLEYKLVL
jgi:hypothetical protein